MDMHDAQTVLWSDADEWLGFIPNDGDDVIIPQGLKVILDQDTPELGTLAVNGTLEFARKDLKLTADNVVVNGEFWIGSEDNPFTHKAEIILTGKEADADVVIADYMGSMHGHNAGHHNHHFTDPINNKALIVTGKLELHGTEVDSWTQLNSTTKVGDTSITLTEAPTGWNVGDAIAIAPTDFDAFEVEERIITDIKGSTIFFDKPLEYKHYGEQQDLGNGKLLDMRAEVTNLSRNISITGSDEGESQILRTRSNPDYYSRAGYGGHTVYLPDSEIKIDGVEFAGLGLSGDLGGYPVHFHHTGDADGSYVKNSSIHHTFQRGLVVHQTDNLLIEGNIIYDTMSHSYFIEDGVETGNRFVDNLAMLPRSTPEEFRIDNPNNGMRKFERASGFWITNQANAFEGNHVAGVPSGHGFWFIHPDDASRTAIEKDDPRGDLPLQKFEDNTAHTLTVNGGNQGYRFDWTSNALELSTSFDTHPNNAPIKDFTAWKVGNMAIQVAPNATVDIEDPILAEARIMIQSASRGHTGNSLIEVINPILVAETENTVEGRTLSSVFGKKHPGPSIALSERPIDFVDTTIIGEDNLKVSGRKEFKDQLTFRGDTVSEPTPTPDPDLTPKPDPDSTPVPQPEPQPNDDTIGEYGTLNLNQAWQTVALNDDYINPVVIVSDPTFNGSDPGAIRLRNVGSNSFQVSLQEPNYKDGKHTNESVSYLVMEAGDWTLMDGTRLSAGTRNTDRLTSQGFGSVDLTGFESTPTILSQVQTFNGGDWVTTRTTEQTSSGFKVAMQEEEALNKGTHAQETIGWLAVDQGQGSDGDTLLEGGTTGRSHSHNRGKVSFAADFDAAPSLLAKLGSFHGSDTANVRLDDISNTSFGVRVHEEQSLDTELSHTNESISFLALEGKSGVLTGLGV